MVHILLYSLDTFANHMQQLKYVDMTCSMQCHPLKATDKTMSAADDSRVWVLASSGLKGHYSMMFYFREAPLFISICSGCTEPKHHNLCRIILKSKCDVPIDVWLVNANHKDQQQGVQQHDERPQPVLAALPAHHQANMLEGEPACCHSYQCNT